jgi:hypothetical protein
MQRPGDWRFSLRYGRIAQLAVFVLLLQLPAASFGQKLEDNTDRHGEDFRDFDLPSPDPLLCRKACVEDDQCRSFTYLKPNTGAGSPEVAHCWLKSGIPAAKRDPAFVSGIVPEKTRPPGKPGEWEVGRSSIGGVMVRIYKLSIKSDGHFVRKNSMNRNKPEEEGTVPPAALEKLNRAIMAAKINTWKASYGGGGCNDCVNTTFRLEVCGAGGKWVRYSGSWELPPQLPADMEAVLAAMEF